MKKNLLLITNGFPFGESERGFLPTEFEKLTEVFHVTVLAKIPMPSNEEWAKLDYDRDRIFCTGAEPLNPIEVLMQGVHRDTILELGRAACNRQGFRLLCKRASAILRYRGRAVQYEKIIEKICENQKIDLIYTYWCTQATLGALLVQQKHPEIKVCTRFHGYDLYQERTEELWQPFRRKIAEKCDLLVFACQDARDYFMRVWPDTEPQKAVCAYIGCRAMEAVPSSDGGRLCLVSCSNLIPLKRVDLIIDALAALSEKLKVDWHHFGDGVLRDGLEEHAQNTLDSRKNISWKFHGAVENKRLNDRYIQLRADVFITLSSTEGGAPVSIQEALAMGIPCIGTDVGGIREEILDGETGWLLPSDPTAEQAAEAIIRAADLSHQEMEDMRSNAINQWSKSFNSTENALRFIHILEAVADNKDDIEA